MRVKKEINVQIGERIKQAREASLLTQEQLAERIDVSPQFVSDLERGVVGISIATLKRICIVLHVSSDQLLFGIASQNRESILCEKCVGLSENHFQILMDIVSKFVEAITP